jgi:voltage-gated potassium channel
VRGLTPGCFEPRGIVAPELTRAEIPSPWRRRAVRRILIGFAAILLVMLYGIAGYLALGWSFLDALYQVVITISGVGFGEVRPATSTAARIHTMILIALGLGTVAYTLGAFVQFLTESELLGYFGHQRMMRQIEALSRHTIVAGYGRVGSLVCEELAAAEQPFVVIDRSPERAGEIEARGFLYVTGDATDEPVLKEAGIERARVLVSAMPDDAENVFITLTARQLCPGLLIIARAEQPSTVRKLKHAGADHVVMPAAIGAHRIVSLVTKPAAVQFAELVTQRTSVAIEMDELPIQASGPLVGHSVRDADLKRRTGVIVVAIKRVDGRLEFPPSGDEILAPGDTIVVLGNRANLDQFRQQFIKA